jgi:hypothetical protein
MFSTTGGSSHTWVLGKHAISGDNNYNAVVEKGHPWGATLGSTSWEAFLALNKPSLPPVIV